MADFEPLFELKNQYRESCPVLLQSGALYREEPTASAEAEETETAEATLPAEQEEAVSPRTFLRLAFRNIDPRAVTSVYVDIHIFDKATNELAVVRDRRYLVPILGRDAVFGADEEIDVDDAAYSFSVAIKKVQFEGEDVFWNGSASLLFENLPEQAKIADVMEDEDLRAQYQRDFTEMAEDKEAALKQALELIPEGSTIAMGGCMSAGEIGLISALEAGNYHYIDRSKMDARAGLMAAYDADIFLSSANAITSDGVMVNIDGNSNRVSCIAQGPRKVIFIVGMNKVCADLDSAMKRARNVAAPINAQRFDIKTPCKETGKCFDCKSPDTICCQFLITRYSRHTDRIHVILVNDTIGY